ncbi:MAG: AAA family ATPase, partial [Clostridia bacterium]|nr:AAA family ATPase [Clostridia bacterium]
MNINLVFNFLKAFLGAFYDKGIGSIFWGFLHIFYNDGYRDAFVNYTDQFGAGEWAVAIIFIILIVAALVAIVWLIVWGFIKLIRINKNAVLPQDLVEECANLKKQIIKMSAEKDRILGMKVSDIGNYNGEDEEEGGEEGKIKEGESRFYKLTEIDQIYENYVPPVYDDEITLPELCDRFRLFACSRRKLFYDIRIIRLFIAGMSTTRLMILQGISGTGKTSLAHCMGLFLNNPTTIASVQPSWRDRTELFGYFNEFTKRFNETEVLKKMYEATWNKNIYITVLDEMNIARVEYYFAELLSILEMPSRDEWVVSLVPSVWPTDPKHVIDGKL